MDPYGMLTWKYAEYLVEIRGNSNNIAYIGLAFKFSIQIHNHFLHMDSKR